MSENTNNKAVASHVHSARLSSSALIASCVAIFAALTISARAWFSPTQVFGSQAPTTKAETITPTLSQDKAVQERGEVVLITLRRTGIEPSEIKQPAGSFLLTIDNRSGSEEIALQLTRETGGRLQDVHIPRKKSNWRDVLNLHPGNYVLTEANHPEWVCHITITPR
jgi:hypothetical protein